MRDYQPLIIIECYILLLSLIYFLRADSLNTKFLSTMVLNTFTLNVPQLVAISGDELFPSRLILTLLTVSIVTYVELSDPSYGSTWKTVGELRKSWITPAIVLEILFILVIFFKIWNIAI